MVKERNIAILAEKREKMVKDAATREKWLVCGPKNTWEGWEAITDATAMPSRWLCSRWCLGESSSFLA
jgi:hypothetical protein